MDIRELNETLIKSMESACDDAIESALIDEEVLEDVFKDEDDIRNYIADDFEFVIDRMTEDWKHYNGCEVNRHVVEVAFEESKFIGYFEDILSAYCGRIIDDFFEDWVTKAFKTMKGEN